MGPAGEGCRRRLRARDRGTPPAPAPRRGTLRACRVPQAGSGCQVPAACCSCLAPPVLVRPGGRGARWDHRESVPSSSVAPDPPGWRCFGTALLSSPFLSGPSENRQEFYGLMMVNDYNMITNFRSSSFNVNTLNDCRISPGYGKTGRMAGTGQGGRFSLSRQHCAVVQSSGGLVVC